MKYFAKKFSALLLSLALVLTMMPFFAVQSFAEDEGYAIEIYVNKTTTGNGVTRDQLNEGNAQLFPFPSSKGQSWSYYIAKGPSYEEVVTKALGVDSLDDIRDCQLVWMNADNVEQTGKNNANNLWVLDVEDLIKATEQFRLVNPDITDPESDDYVVKGAFDKDPTNVKVEKIANAQLIPVIAGKWENTQTGDYEEASKKLTSEWDTAPSSIRPFLGGNTNKDAMLKENGKVNDASVNFLGRFSTSNMPKLNVRVPAPEGEAVIDKPEISFSDKNAQTVSLSFADITDAEAKLLYGDCEWATDNDKVATVDRNGKITPTGVGTCTVTGKIGDSSAVCKVTVNESAFPAPAVTDGQTAKVGGSVYKVTSASAKTASFTKAANAKSATVPATVKINGETLVVTSIAPKAFKGTGVKTLTVKSKKLTKASVKGSLKGSKINTVKVKVGKKKENSKYVKKYKKIFTKKNAGKKVKVK